MMTNVYSERAGRWNRPQPVTTSGSGRALTDAAGRVIDHLRLSVTGACDLRCVYCRPGRQNACGQSPDAFSDKQRVEFIRFLYDQYGLAQVRLTGGEPLLYERLADLIESIRRSCPGLSLALTTNGRLLARHAATLHVAGLDRLNVSVDSLDGACYRRITGGRLADVLDGLDAARAAGFPEPKINTVVLRGINDREVVGLARWAMARGSDIRFLEAMPIGPAGEFNRQRFVSAAEIRRCLKTAMTLTPLESAPGSTASQYRATAGSLQGIVGTIAPVSEPFCASCRRIRLTAAGRMYPCLLHSVSLDIRAAWRHGRLDPEAMTRSLGTAARSKPKRGSVQRTEMAQLGG